MLARSLFAVSALLLLTGCVSRTPEKVSPLVLAEKGGSRAAIAVPDTFTNRNVEKHLLNAAQILSAILADSTGAKIPVVREKQLLPGQPAIMLGATDFAKAKGINTGKMKYWESVIKVSGNRLILAGLDRPSHVNAPVYPYRYILSSVRAMTEFLQKYAGVRFFVPGKNGIYAPKLDKLVLPGDLDVRSVPEFKYGRRRPVDWIYEIANGYLWSTDTFLYGGHSYYSAVPEKKYGKSHPEYFRLAGSTRSPAGNHLCISNPEVQRLMLKEMAAKCDSGYEFVELAQTDGYVPCSCKKCREFGNTSDEGEKLWILHRSLAERFKKIRPGKKVLIISYGPTAEPPSSFREFPDNVAIELCNYSEKLLAKWSTYKVPHGFTVYLYNWGGFHPMGFGPKRTLAYLEKQLRLFRKYNVKAIFFCGIGELYGLEGPVYYAYNRMMADPGLKGAAAVREYCRGFFGESALPMEKFYSVIDDALGSYIGNAEGLTGRIIAPRGVIPGVFTPDIIAILDRQLETAEKLAVSPAVKLRLKLVRTEYDFFRATVRAVTFYNTYRSNPTWSNFDQLELEVNKRNAVINRLFAPGARGRFKRLPGWERIYIFGPAVTRSTVFSNGRGAAIMGAPFTWDFKLLRERKLLPCSYVPKTAVARASSDPYDLNFEKGAWRSAAWVDMTGIQLGTPTVPSRFKLLYDKKYLYIAFEGTMQGKRTYRVLGQDGHCWSQDAWEIMLDPFGDRTKHYHFLLNFTENSRYDARAGFSGDILDPDFGKSDVSWNGKWDYKTRCDGKTARAVVRVALDSFPVPPPVPGTVWTANFGREEFHPGEKVPELLLWAPNPEARNFHDRDKFGELVFK